MIEAVAVAIHIPMIDILQISYPLGPSILPMRSWYFYPLKFKSSQRSKSSFTPHQLIKVINISNNAPKNKPYF